MPSSSNDAVSYDDTDESNQGVFRREIGLYRRKGGHSNNAPLPPTAAMSSLLNLLCIPHVPWMDPLMTLKMIGTEFVACSRSS